MPLTQDCLTLQVDLTSGHYNRGTQSTSLWLTFLTSVQQNRTLELCVQQEYTLPQLLEICQKPLNTDVSYIPDM